MTQASQQKQTLVHIISSLISQGAFFNLEEFLKTDPHELQESINRHYLLYIAPEYIKKEFFDIMRKGEGEVIDLIQQSKSSYKLEMKDIIKKLEEGESHENTPLLASKEFFKDKGQEYTFSFLYSLGSGTKQLSKFYLHPGAIAIKNAKRAYEEFESKLFIEEPLK
ncbi:MAG: hypothetical protein KDK61_08525 [Simkania sp.]|nr:hypothetical protein [Nanoarchaeota archaeon]MCB1084343.1 hypothetical protein [Simkania sp.]